MSLEIPSFVPDKIAETLRAITDRGSQSPLKVALLTAIPLIALYSAVPALSSSALKPKTYPSLGTLVVAENSRLSQLKKHVHELYPADTYGKPHTVELTKGRVTYWITGPEEGKRVRYVRVSLCIIFKA